MKNQRAFTLLEILVVIAIVGILAALGMPAFTHAMANTRIRSEAQSIQAGVQLARSEAVRRNVNMDFVLTDDAAPGLASVGNPMGRGWVVRTAAGVLPPVLIESKSIEQSGGGAATSKLRINDANNDLVADAGAVGFITFSGFGRTGLAATQFITITSPAVDYGACATIAVPGSPLRCLTVRVAIGGQSLLCDPAVAVATDTRGCPP